MTVIVHATDSGDGVIYQQAIKYQAVSAVKTPEFLQLIFLR
jgi:hypothetical protein